MKRLLMTTLVVGAVQAAPVFAASLDAFAVANITSTMNIGGGGPLQPSFEVTESPPDLQVEATSALDAPDAVPFENSNTVIAGAAPDSPSIFARTNSTTRNVGAEGGFGSVNHQLYRVVEVDENFSADVTARGYIGESQAQASISTDFFETEGGGRVYNERVVTFVNERATEFTFGIQGLVEMDLISMATGEGASAKAIATLDFWFRSDDPLEIVFAQAGPYNPDTSMSSGAMASLDLETDVQGTEHLSLIGVVTAFGTDNMVEQSGTASGSMEYVLGITLQPGQVLTMSHIASYETNAVIATPPVAPVPLPAGFVLLASGGCVLCAMRRRKRT